MATQFLGTYSDLISPEGLMNTLLPRISPFPNIYRFPPFPDHDMLVCSGLAVHGKKNFLVRFQAQRRTGNSTSSRPSFKYRI